ncbi:MAG: hypothetical protein MZW92_43665 [Comamonadaceae bacterium]|nr:hypothetical protein [Comamonadaceae bacterium]
MDVADNLKHIRHVIAAACTRCGRDPQACAWWPSARPHPDPGETAYAAGQIEFGESYVQEFLTKAERVTSPVQWQLHRSPAEQQGQVPAGQGKPHPLA